MMDEKIKLLKQTLPHHIQTYISNQIPNKINFQSITANNCAEVASYAKTQTLISLLDKQTIKEPQSYTVERPNVLVFCQPSQEIAIEQDKIFPYVPISYASWIEGAGGKCIPMPYNLNEGSMQYLLQRCHGLLIPGGGSNLYKNYNKKQGYGPVTLGFQKLWRFIQKLWNKGVYFPIWGTCLGLQIMLMAISNDVKVLSNLNSRMHQLQIYSEYCNSEIMKNMPIRLKIAIQNNKIMNFQHAHGISVAKFLNYPKLQQKLKITSISKDKDGKWFCSALQGRQNPIFLTQYHPQKQAYQWSKNGDIIHHRDSIQVSQFLASSFVNICKKCKPLSKFADEKQQYFFRIHQYKQIHTPQKMYKVYAIDFKYRDQQGKKLRKQSQRQKAKSLSVKHPFI